jgi:hypothetical protein
MLFAGVPWQAAQAAAPLAKPTGPVILTVTGAISETNAPGRAEFDRKMLEALGLESMTTTTNWTDGKQVFEGVRVSKLLDAVGAKGTTLSTVALDDYTSTVPMEVLTKFPALFALSMNGKALTPRDKGPVWIVLPRDDYPVLADPKYDSYWVWQLKSIVVK